MESDRTDGRSDRVAAAGAIVALVGCLLLPFAQLRPNRLAAGVSHPLSAAGPAGWLLAVLAAAMLAGAFAPKARRGAALTLLSSAGFVAAAWAAGSAAVRLLPGGGAFARVSLGAGAWLALLGVVMVSFAAGRAGTPRALRLAADAAAVAGVVAAVVWGGIRSLSIAMEYAVQSGVFWGYVAQHLALAGTGLGIGTVIGVPLGIWAARTRVVRDVSLTVTGVIETIPSLALLGLLIAPLAALSAAVPALAAVGVSGIGPAPAVIALTLYALLPIVRNTYVGLASVDPSIVDAGRGMGMSRPELLWRVEMPLALPLVLEGVRASAVLVVGITAVTAFIGAGGLGVLIFTGLGQQADDLTLLGAVPVILLAVAVDVAIRAFGRLAVSPGIRGSAA